MTLPRSVAGLTPASIMGFPGFVPASWPELSIVGGGDFCGGVMVLPTVDGSPSAGAVRAGRLGCELVVGEQATARRRQDRARRSVRGGIAATSVRRAQKVRSPYDSSKPS